MSTSRLQCALSAHSPWTEPSRLTSESTLTPISDLQWTAQERIHNRSVDVTGRISSVAEHELDRRSLWYHVLRPWRWVSRSDLGQGVAWRRRNLGKKKKRAGDGEYFIHSFHSDYIWDLELITALLQPLHTTHVTTPQLQAHATHGSYFPSPLPPVAATLLAVSLPRQRISSVYVSLARQPFAPIPLPRHNPSWS